MFRVAWVGLSLPLLTIGMDRTRAKRPGPLFICSREKGLGVNTRAFRPVPERGLEGPVSLGSLRDFRGAAGPPH